MHTKNENNFLYVPLGGVGKIGMNMYLYGFGKKNNYKWIMVDCGIAFANADLPGIESIVPDISFIKNNIKNLLGIFITHAHEDHQGGLHKIWPLLNTPIYTTSFAANLINRKILETKFINKIKIIIVNQGDVIHLNPFSIEFISVTHSIPEANALAITTNLGTVLHTGDWKLDNNPIIGSKTNIKRFKELGKKGILALIGDSTNVFKLGKSSTEYDISKGLENVINNASGCIVVTSFASNAARIYSIIKAAEIAKKNIVIVGRSLWRIIDIALEEGCFPNLPVLYTQNNFKDLSRNNIVIIVTGTQGESRAALSRIAKGEHPIIKLKSNDTVIFSSKTIPGNEKSVGYILNKLAYDNVNVINNKSHKVHVTGHPLREELIKMYDWIKPKIAIPIHGEAIHICEHAKLASSLGIKTIIKAFNGTMVHLAPNNAKIIGEIKYGHIYEDGNLLITAEDNSIKERRKLSYSGIIFISIVFDKKGNLCSDPKIFLIGIPEFNNNKKNIFNIIINKVNKIIEIMPTGIRKNQKIAKETLRINIRKQLYSIWGKKTIVQIMLSYIN